MNALPRPSPSASSRYAPAVIALHWITVLLIVAVYVLMEFRGIYPRGSEGREMMKSWHYTVGLSVLVLAVLRLGLRLAGSTPPIEPPPPAWQQRLSGLAHLALYALMIGMPLLGWLTLSAGGDPIPFFGAHLPPLVGASESLADNVKEVHEAFGTIGYALIGLHAAAALFHHYRVGDNTLLRMMPRRR